MTFSRRKTAKLKKKYLSNRRLKRSEIEYLISQEIDMHKKLNFAGKIALMAVSAVMSAFQAASIASRPLPRFALTDETDESALLRDIETVKAREMLKKQKAIDIAQCAIEGAQAIKTIVQKEEFVPTRDQLLLKYAKA
jgi:hypothetical protein